jgi:hypothetical protein
MNILIFFFTKLIIGIFFRLLWQFSSKYVIIDISLTYLIFEIGKLNNIKIVLIDILIVFMALNNPIN